MPVGLSRSSPMVHAGELRLHPDRAHAHPLSAGMLALGAPEATVDLLPSLTRDDHPQEAPR